MITIKQLQILLNNLKQVYVRKQIGKDLSENNFSNKYKTDVENNTLERHIHLNKDTINKITQTLLDTWNTVTNKVDKVEGKNLSTNDFNNVYKDKLDNSLSNIPTINGVKVEGDKVPNDFDMYNALLDPNNHPIESIQMDKMEKDIIEIPFILEVGGLDRKTGALVTRDDAVRSNDYIDIIPNTNYTFSNGLGYNTTVFFYDSLYNPIDLGEGYIYTHTPDGTARRSPKNAVMTRFYSSDINDITVPFKITYEQSEPIPEVKMLEFIKQYFAKGKYSLECTELDPNLWQLELRSQKDEFAIFAIKPPREKPHEATIALSLSGENTKQFADFSCMRYDETSQGQVCIICQKRGSKTPLPYFFVGFNDGQGAGRVQKFRVDSDAIPIRMTAQGLVVKRNNIYDNEWTVEETCVVNLAEMHDKIEELETITTKLDSRITYLENLLANPSPNP